MAMESRVMMNKVGRIARLVLFAGFMAGVAAEAQLPITSPAPVTAGSVIPFNHGSTGVWNQIYSMKVDPLHGHILFLDSAASELYDLAPGATSPTSIASPAPSTQNSDCSDLEKKGSYWNAAVAFDKWDNLYVTDRYGSAVQFCRVPYNASTGTWTFSNADIWTGPTYTNSSGNQVAIPPQDLQVGDDGVTFYVSTSSTDSIFKYTVDENGDVTSVTALATGLEDMVSNISVDHAGNLFFIENAYDSPSARVNGIREIAAGSAAVNGDGTGAAESALPRIDQGGWKGIKGMYFDAQGNLFFASENNSSYGGEVDGVFMIPNEGTPASPNLVWADTVMVSPVSSGFPPLVDPRGLIYIATGGSGNWVPSGVNGPSCDTTSAQTEAATCLASSIVLWKPGAAILGSTAVGGAGAAPITAYAESAGGGSLTLTANNTYTENQIVTISAKSTDALYPLNGMSFYVLGTGLSNTSFEISSSTLAASASGSTTATATLNQAQTIYYMFSQPTTPSKISLTQPSGSNFTVVANSPEVNPTATAPVLPCTAGTTYPAFSATEIASNEYSWCPYYVQLNSANAGAVEGEVQLLDSNNNVIDGSNAYLSGVGQGAAVSVVSSATVQPVASGLNDPKQVAADLWGNTYVADSALKAIEKYPAGTTSPTSGKVFGSGLSGPTGVAVDGVGNLYIGDSGSVYEIPYVNGALASSEQTKIASGLGGGNLNLAVDGEGNVYVADQANKQVEAIPNPQTALVEEGLPVQTIGSGFTGPSAIATDSAGNVWVADGTNLWEITMPYGGASKITGSLEAPVTGLAVDPSGSVFVAGANGLVWIPFSTATGTLNVNGQVLITSGLGSSSSPVLPWGVAIDGTQNTYATYGSGSSAGLAQLGIGGTFDFSSYGEVNPNVPFEVDAQVLNLGNLPLMVSDDPTVDLVSGAGAADFYVAAATENAPACSSTTVTPPGGSCYLGLILQSTTAGEATATIAAESNAVNAAAGVSLAVSGNVIQDLRPATSSTVTITPTTGTGCSGSTYPGCDTITVVVTAGTGYGTPTGTVTLAVGSANGNQPRQTMTLDSTGTATFTYSALLGGTYNVGADYGGSGTAGASQNTCASSTPCFAGSASKTTFTVARATPVIALGVPVTNDQCLNTTTYLNGSASTTTQNGQTVNPCQPNPGFVTSWAGTNYVNWTKPVYLSGTVTSTVGTPTGTVSFLQNGQPADPSQGVDGAIAVNGDGVSTFSLQNLGQGVYSLTANYSGDVNYLPESVSVQGFEVIVPSVQITAPSGTVSVTPGVPAEVTLTLMPLVGFSSNVSLECNSANAPVPLAPTTPSTTLPQFSECTFAYADTTTGTSPVGKSGPTASSITITISTNVAVNGGSSASLAKQAPWTLAGLFGLGLLGVITGRKKLYRFMALICLGIMLSGLFLGITACTNAGYSTPPPAPKVNTPTGSYSVQIITYDPQGLTQDSLTTPMFTLPIQVQ
jgi:sugar lactone lactonase YvrE